MDPEQALAFVERHGIVLESGKGPVASLAEEIAGSPIRGSWWSHAKGREIFAATRAVRDSPHVLVCRLAGGRVTYVHWRVWPALVKLAPEIGVERLAALRETHTASGKHALETVPFPKWVPREVMAEARALEPARARELLGAFAPSQS